MLPKVGDTVAINITYPGYYLSSMSPTPTSTSTFSSPEHSSPSNLHFFPFVSTSPITLPTYHLIATGSLKETFQTTIINILFLTYSKEP